MSKIHKSLSLNGVMGGVRKTLNFSKATVSGYYSTYRTADKDEQDFIENTDYFKSGVLYVFKTDEAKPEKEVVKTSKKKSKEVKTENKTYKSRQDLFEQVRALCSDEEVNKKMSVSELYTLALAKGYTFTEEKENK